MTEDRDLLPWILGALSIAAVAMAVAVGLTGRTAPAHASGQTTSSAPALPTAELNPKTQSSSAPGGSTAAPSASSSLASSLAPSSAAPSSAAPSTAAQAYPEPVSVQASQAQSAPAPNAGGNQIWECTTNGVKTFSNSRCGSTAVLRDLGPINVMDASPASNVHWYGAGPNDASGYYDPGYDPSPAQPEDNSYPVVVGVPYLARRRLERPRQAAHQDQAHHDQGHHVPGHPRGN